ncbi:MAG: NAD(P)-dependent oxidoreductase [Candidatus Uhrbacteria bacterium]|nr:NAD(P)-dependent oxidoreductase [Candidatus Uhrbacteria bacterium]
MPRVAVVGAKGFLGSALMRAFSRSSEYTAVAVTRENCEEMKKDSYDVLINCAMPSARFWAKQNPEKDFVETVEKTAKLLYGWSFKKFVQVSTVSARCQLDTVYGRHKAATEKLCDFDQHLIVRFGALYSQNMKKGVLVDMMQNKTVFVDGESRYCFADVDFAANWIASNLHRSGIVEVGGRNAMALKDVAKHIGSTGAFEGALDHQEIENPESDFPEASEVLLFLDNYVIPVEAGMTKNP